MRHSVLKDLPYDKRNPILVSLQLFVFAIRDLFSDPWAAGAKILNGAAMKSVAEAPLLGIVVAAVITIWGLRLSYNFWRKV